MNRFPNTLSEYSHNAAELVDYSLGLALLHLHLFRRGHGRQLPELSLGVGLDLELMGAEVATIVNNCSARDSPINLARRANSCFVPDAQPCC